MWETLSCKWKTSAMMRSGRMLGEVVKTSSLNSQYGRICNQRGEKGRKTNCDQHNREYSQVSMDHSECVQKVVVIFLFYGSKFNKMDMMV